MTKNHAFQRRGEAVLRSAPSSPNFRRELGAVLALQSRPGTLPNLSRPPYSGGPPGTAIIAMERLGALGALGALRRRGK